MERPIFKPIGTPTEQLDTPSLIVDVESLDHNIATVASFFKNSTAKLRPHVEAHRTPAIAHKQMAAGGHVGGIAVSSLGQAEVFVPNGFSDVFVANLVVTPQKITRLCALAHHANIGVAVDSPANVADLSDAAVANGVSPLKWPFTSTPDSACTAWTRDHPPSNWRKPSSTPPVSISLG